MERKSSSQLVVLTLAAIIALQGCEYEEQTDVGVYRSVEECIAAKVFQASDCEKEFDKTQASYKSDAPQYAGQSDCQSDFQDCSQAIINGRSVYIPQLYGFTISHSQVPLPLYRHAGSFVTSESVEITTSTGVVHAPQSVFEQSVTSTHSTTVRTSAFGSKASGTVTRGSFGRGFSGGAAE